MLKYAQFSFKIIYILVGLLPSDNNQAWHDILKFSLFLRQQDRFPFAQTDMKIVLNYL